jgi:hypothetical protein
MRYRFPILAAVGGALALASTLPAHAQTAPATDAASVPFPDVPANHWAYQAVADLAAKGYVKGYPDGTYGGHRAMTRYEFATVIERMLQTVNDLAAKVAAAPAPQVIQTPSGGFASVDDLNKLQALVDTFKAQLVAIGTPIAPVQDQIDALRQDIADVKDKLAKIKAEADSSYGEITPGTSMPAVPIGVAPLGDVRKFQISGFIQARYQDAESGNQSLFPNGTPAKVGGQSSFTGDYAVGGNRQDLFARRVRIKMTGTVTPNTRYSIQLDAANNPATNVTASSNPNQINVLDANGQYTFGAGNPTKEPTVIAGGIINYFGYMLPQSPADFLAPERPLAFSEGGVGMWQNQDFDKGAYVTLPLLNCLTAYAGAWNGGGRYTELDKTRPDGVYRLRFQKSTGMFKMLGLGASYYDGTISRSDALAPATGQANPEPSSFTGGNYQEGKKNLTGFDAQIQTTSGIQLLGEYVSGQFDERTYFGSATSLTQNAWAPGNKVDGWYVQGGFTLFSSHVNSLQFAGDYDVFDRSESGISATATDAAGNPLTGGASGSSFTDKNYGYGAIYKLTRASQFKIWWEEPTEVAHAAGTSGPIKVGLLTTEFLVRY